MIFLVEPCYVISCSSINLWLQNIMKKQTIIENKKIYRWFYNNIHSSYYNIMIKWCLFPLGGEYKCRDELISHIQFSNSETILDMCCGTGGARCSILKHAGEKSQIIGMDLSSGQLKHASQRRDLQNVQFIEGDVASTCFPDCIFDKVFITHALHEMSHETRLQVLREAKRLIKEDGNLIVLELDEPDNLILRIFVGFWFLYWLPLNPETPTRKDLLKYGLSNEIEEVGFRNITKESKFRGLLQTVQATK